MSTMQYVLVTGGVLSGLGKGVVASSVGVLLKASGLQVTNIKIDPYLNQDAGTMSPFEHGEVYVLDDGSEADLDLGNYERFLGTTLRGDNNITTGKVYQRVIDKERRGDYLGKTVQVVPHVTNEIMEWIERVSVQPVTPDGRVPDVCVIELGGTVGDIESMPFVEAMRQFQFRVGKSNMCVLHVSLVPQLSSVGEQKSKPTQHSVRELRALGLTPDLVVCRSEKPLNEEVARKISSFCHVAPNAVVGLHNVSNLYKVPLMLRSQLVDELVLRRLGREYDGDASESGLRYWRELSEVQDQLADLVPVKIALVGKYTGLADSYLSVLKALRHASIRMRRPCKVIWVEAGELVSGAEGHDNAWLKLREADGILVPGGFGARGIEGMVLAAKHAREERVPFLGICLGMQLAVVEFCRHVLGWKDADSTEFNKHTSHPVVEFMPEIDSTIMGGNMRLGSRPTLFVEHHRETSALYRLYGEHAVIHERHRHRYEVAPSVVAECEAKGMHFVGRAEPLSAEDTSVRNEMLELSPELHPFYVGVQFHPEFKTTPLVPSPPFMGLLTAAAESK